MKWIMLTIIIVYSIRPCCARSGLLRGTVYDITDKTPIPGAWVSLVSGKAVIAGSATDSAGYFQVPANCSSYILHVVCPGFVPYFDTISVFNTAPRSIYLQPNSNILNEVRIIEKVNPVIQKDDTTEYDARAFKVHHDADAYDLVRKMPGMSLSGKNVTSKGESVTRLLIDGKPFLSDDPYAALKNFPAYVIKSVQVYQEASEQEQFTGFKEGTGNTTINIVTRPDKKQGRFGKITGGLGNGSVYALNGNVNFFDRNRRLTLIGQSNNNSTQNFTDGDTYESSHWGSGNGVFNISNLAVNYTDQWTPHTEVSCNITSGHISNRLQHELWREYLLTADSGRQYRELGYSDNKNNNYRVHAKVNHTIDAANALTVQSSFSFLNTKNTGSLSAVTTADEIPVNQISNHTGLSGSSWNTNQDILFKHKFSKPGRTFSVNLNTSFRKSSQANTMMAQSLDWNTGAYTNIIDQQSPSLQSGADCSVNTAYTEKLSRSALQWQYKITYEENQAKKYVYDLTRSPNTADSQLSAVSGNSNVKQKTGMDYQYHTGRLTASAGIYGQYTYFSNELFFPVATTFDYHFKNLLPQGNLQYRLSQTSNLQLVYNTGATTPSVVQLQGSINNTNPLYLQSGNPDLQQTYRHNLSLRYLLTNAANYSQLNLHLAAAIVRHVIGNNIIIAANDTLIGNVLLYKGGQLATPVNLEGYRSINAGAGYAWPVKALKSNLALDLNGSLSRVPSLINGRPNAALRQSLAIGINFNSNISEYIDYTFIANTNYSRTANTLYATSNNSYFSQDAAFTVTLTLLKSCMLSADLYYQYNDGIPGTAGNNYVLANVSMARKLFRGKQGCIRLSFYDLLNQNKNIQYTVTDTYITTTRTAALQRYATLSFTWSFNRFTAGRQASQ